MPLIEIRLFNIKCTRRNLWAGEVYDEIAWPSLAR